MAKAPVTTTDTSAAALSAALAAPAPEKDEFADAFASFADPKPAVEPTTQPAAQAQDGKEAPAEDEDPGTEIEGAPGAPGEGAEAPAEELAAEAEELAAEAKPKPKAPETKPTAADDAISRLADILSKRDEPKPQVQPQVQQPAVLYTEAEVTQLQTFYKEWPEVAPAVEVLLRGAMTNVTNSIFTEVARVLGPKLQLLDQLANNVTYSQLQREVPDYNDELVDHIAEWIKTQPTYLQPAFTSVMQNGTASDITDLVNRYRQETGVAAPEGDRTTRGTRQPAPVKPAAPLSTAAKKAVAALAPVTSKRTGNTQLEPQSYDEAFDVFAKAG